MQPAFNGDGVSTSSGAMALADAAPIPSHLWRIDRTDACIRPWCQLCRRFEPRRRSGEAR